MKRALLPLLAATSSSPRALSVTLVTPAAPETGFNLGTAANPAGTTIAADSQCLLRDGKPWTPVMGEFHYSRYPSPSGARSSSR
jgi:hypothetical protein